MLLLAGCFEPNRAYWMNGHGTVARAVLPHERDADEFHPSLAVVELADFWRAYERDGLRTDEGIEIGPCVLRVLEG